MSATSDNSNRLGVERVRQLLADLGVEQSIETAHLSFLVEALGSSLDDPAGEELLRDAISTAIERLAMQSSGDLEQRRRLFDAAFVCRRAAQPATLERRPAVLHHFCMCVDGLIGERWAELGMLLRERPADDYLALPDTLPWVDELLVRVCRAFVLLCRKGGGWDDVHAAAAEVRLLRQLQQTRETGDTGAGDRALAAQLLIRYNLARIVDLVAEYTISGTPADAAIPLRRHRSNVEALLALGVERDPDVEHVADLL